MNEKREGRKAVRLLLDEIDYCKAHIEQLLKRTNMQSLDIVENQENIKRLTGREDIRINQKMQEYLEEVSNEVSRLAPRVNEIWETLKKKNIVVE